MAVVINLDLLHAFPSCQGVCESPSGRLPFRGPSPLPRGPASPASRLGVLGARQHLAGTAAGCGDLARRTEATPAPAAGGEAGGEAATPAPAGGRGASAQVASAWR